MWTVEALTWTSFIISVCLPWWCCFLTAHGAMCICRVEGEVVGGTGDRSSCFLPRSYKLSSSSHQSSVQISVLRFDIFILCKKILKKILTTNCSSPMYWNKRVTFYTSGTVLEWDCHMLISLPPPTPPCILYLYAIFWWSCWSPRCWAKTQEPSHPVSHPCLWSDAAVSYRSSPSPRITILHPVHPVETVLYKVFQVGKPWDHLAPTRAQTRRQNQPNNNALPM